MKRGEDAVAAALRDPEALPGWPLARWDRLIRQARPAKLLGRLHALLAERGLLERVPAQPARHLAAARRVADQQRLAARREVEYILAALEKTGVPVILLKGAAYVMADLPVAAGRSFADIDILVPKAALPDVEAALMLHGWASSHHDDYDQRYYRQWMHEIPPMQHLQRGTVIDVHHAILPETARMRADSQRMRADAQPVPGHAGLFVFEALDMVLHSAAHLFNEGELDGGLRDLVDLDSLLRDFGALPGFWERLPARAQVVGLGRPLYYALRYTRRLLGTPVPRQALERARDGAPGALVAPLMDALYTRALRPPHASADDRLTPLARALLYVRGHWLRMPAHLLAYHLTRKALRREPDADDDNARVEAPR